MDTFFKEKWGYLKNLYGENVFDNTFSIKAIAFQAWVSLESKGYGVNIHLELFKKPINFLKNWDTAQGASILLIFNGDLDYFDYDNSQLLELFGKTAKLSFNPPSEYGTHWKITISVDNNHGGRDQFFWAKDAIVDIFRIT